MPELYRWPRCAHETDHWHEAWYESGQKPAVDYAYARCKLCDRPLVWLPAELEDDRHERRFLRRHTAWHYLGKEGEHAGNTAVIRYRTVPGRG